MQADPINKKFNKVHPSMSGKECGSLWPIPLYTSVPTIHEGWQLVPKEPTQPMRQAWMMHKDFAFNAWEAMLSAAPEYKGEPDWSTTKKWGG